MIFSPPPLLNQLTNFYDTWCKYYAIRENTTLRVYQFLTKLTKCRTRTCEVRTTQVKIKSLNVALKTSDGARGTGPLEYYDSFFRNGNENYHLGQNFLYITNLISSYENLVSILVCVVPLAS